MPEVHKKRKQVQRMEETNSLTKRQTEGEEEEGKKGGKANQLKDV